MADNKPTATSQILTTVLTAAAGWAAQRAVRSLWARRGGPAPRNAADPNVSAVAAVVFAAVAAAVGAIAQRAATRGAEQVAARLHPGSGAGRPAAKGTKGTKGAATAGKAGKAR